MSRQGAPTGIHRAVRLCKVCTDFLEETGVTCTMCDTRSEFEVCLEAQSEGCTCGKETIALLAEVSNTGSGVVFEVTKMCEPVSCTF